MVQIKNILASVLVVSVLFMAGCSTVESDDSKQDYDDLASQSATSNTSPTQLATDSVVAAVNGEEINSGDVSAIQDLFAQQAQQVSKEEALEQLINQKVLEQAIQEANVVVTTQDAESAIEDQLTAQGATLDEYKRQLELQGVSYESELENVQSQLAIQQYFQLQLEGQSFDVSTQEAQEFYELFEEQSTEEVPSYEELQPQIIAQLQQQKQQEAISNIVNELRMASDIEYR